MSAGNKLPNLDKIFRENDEADFLSSTGSNLAAIFGMQNKVPDAQAPAKQPAQKKKPKSAFAQPIQTSKTEVIIAKPVYAFKLKNDTYVPMGKLGMALTGNITQKAYQIILYKTKQEHISVATVVSDFMYTVQENTYSSYYDNNNENWSILFESLDISIDFAREIGMAKYLSVEGRARDILFQDLTPITKDTNAKEGNNISIKYFITTEIVQPFKHTSAIPQTTTVEISTDDNWERMLLGTTKGLRRILFLPPSKQISLGPGFPKERNIMLEIEIMEIKALEEKSEDSKTGNSNKATILSRMAKVGQSMLPKINTVTSVDSEDTDSEDNVSQKSPQQKKEPLGTVLQKRNILQEHSEEVSNSLQKILHSMDENSSSSPSVTTVQPSYGQMSTLQQHTVPLAIPTVMDQGLNLMLSETRMANTELRMGMYKISDNVQKLFDKFHAFELQNAMSPSNNDKISMDATLKMLLAMSASQIEKKGTESHKEPVETDNIPAGNTFEIPELRNEIVDLKIQLKDAIDRLMEKEYCMKNAETEKLSLIVINQNLEERIKDLQRSLNNANDTLLKTQGDLQEIKTFNSGYHKMVTEIRDQVFKSNITSNTSNNTISKSTDTTAEKDQATKNKEIKCIMNKTYQTLLEKFEDESYSTDYIKSTIASTIKSITLLVLGESQEQLERYSEEAGADEVDEYSEEAIQQRETRQSIDISAIQDEPPPIPPNDTDMDSD